MVAEACPLSRRRVLEPDYRSESQSEAEVAFRLDVMKTTRRAHWRQAVILLPGSPRAQHAVTVKPDIKVTLLSGQTEMREVKGGSCKCRPCFMPKPAKRRPPQLSADDARLKVKLWGAQPHLTTMRVSAKQARPTHV
jgi:hypothetical protein